LAADCPQSATKTLGFPEFTAFFTVNHLARDTMGNSIRNLVGFDYLQGQHFLASECLNVDFLVFLYDLYLTIPVRENMMTLISTPRFPQNWQCTHHFQNRINPQQGLEGHEQEDLKEATPPASCGAFSLCFILEQANIVQHHLCTMCDSTSRTLQRSIFV
jgi:hypothetical protein